MKSQKSIQSKYFKTTNRLKAIESSTSSIIWKSNEFRTGIFTHCWDAAEKQFRK